MKRPLIPCSHCFGSGKVELPEHLLKVLEMVFKHRRVSAPEVLRMIGGRSGVTAMNNRLEDLRRLGLVIRERTGNAWYYSPKRE